MRCPECAFFCSDSRDICPKCFIDLRPHKHELSLPVGDPRASYEELLEAEGLTAKKTAPPPKPAKEKSSPGFLRRIASLFSPARPQHPPLHIEITPSTPQPHTAAAKTAAQPSSPSGAPAKKTPKISTIAPTPKVIDLSNIEEDLDKVIDQMIENEPVTFEAVPVEKKPGNAAAKELNFEFVDENAAEETEAASESALAAAQVLSELGDEQAAEAAPAPRTPIPELPCFAANDAEPASAFYADASREIEQRAPAVMELSYRQIAAKEDGERLAILFDLARDYLADPQAQRRYVEKIETSAERKVDAGTLAQQLKSVERAIEAPTFSLKKGSAIPAQPRKETQPEPALPESASWRLRSKSASIDLLFMIAVSMAITFGIVGRELIVASLDRWMGGGIEPLDVVFPAATFLAVLSFLSIVYPLACLLTARHTLGSFLTGMRIVSADGRPPKAGQIIVRACSLPLSVLSLGILPILRGGPARHDLISGTFFTPRS